MPAKRTPDEIRASIEQNRQELGSSLVRLRDEVTELTDWRGQVRRNQQNLQIAAAAAGFVIAGGIGGLGSALFGRGRRKRRR
jgi:prefoldin subunit 5